MRLELSLESHPHHVVTVGEVSEAPAVGDFVQHALKHEIVGYVKRRRFSYEAPSVVVVRVWLHSSP